MWYDLKREMLCVFWYVGSLLATEKFLFLFYALFFFFFLGRTSLKQWLGRKTGYWHEVNVKKKTVQFNNQGGPLISCTMDLKSWLESGVNTQQTFSHDYP